ncbi:MAG: ISL3 family transposase [Microthrixaceae bacterium]|nr:ISL3 family transposase [Microthrixaceae bacterium]
MTVFHDSQSTTALVGMAGFVVGAQTLIDGEWWLHVETTASVVGCEVCGTRAVGHGRTRTPVRDLEISGRPTVLVWAKRRWRCPDPDCEVSTWSEHSEQINPKAVMTERARKALADIVNIEGDTIASAAATFGAGWHTANTAVAAYTDPVIADPGRLEGVTAIGVDEKRFLNATPKQRTRFTTQIVDLENHRILDVVEGRSRSALGEWLAERGEEWCAQIQVATLDPAAGYRAALEEHLPNATLVVDHFHAIKLGNTAIDDVRRRVQQDTLGHRGRKGDPLYRARRVLLSASERLTEERFEWMQALVAAGDPDGELGAAWNAKELLRAVYASNDLAHAKRRLTDFYQYAAEVDVHEVIRLARTIDRWQNEILAYHTMGHTSNGRVENLHMLTEKIRRNSHGFTNITNYRRRILGCLGTQWDTIPTHRIRGRQPHLIA